MDHHLNKFSSFVLMLILGILIAVQYRALQSGFKYVTFEDVSTIHLELQTEEAELSLLKKDLESAKLQLAELQSAEDTEALVSILDKDLDFAYQMAGVTEMTGEGVVILITDGERELMENEDPNNLLVHDVDIRAIVDDLRDAGAEAISINGQRVVFNKSKIQCTGPTIKINDKVFAQPFIIKAIGNSKFLKSSINAPGKYGYILRQWGVFVEVNTSVSVTIPKYEGPIESLYMATMEEE